MSPTSTSPSSLYNPSLPSSPSLVVNPTGSSSPSMTGTFSSTGISIPGLAERKSTQNEEINRDEFVKVSIIDFYEKDSDSNIRFDEKNRQEIKAASLVKLIEKLTGSAAGTL
jgi:hypothetical protein